jgi:glycosyltransferase involved in cell wall biosynthesis/GT2 family glycosyltransferase
MPFKQLKNKTTTWEPNEKGIQQANLNKLVEGAKMGEQYVGLPDPIKNSISKFMESTIHGGERLTEANHQINKSLASISKKGIQPVDILIPVYGGLHIVKLCVESILQRTNWPYKVTFIDDASPDHKTTEYLEHIVEKHPANFTLIRNRKNKGFASTVNVGFRATTNPYVCILNSDVIVTDGWLTKMVMALEADERNQIVNPCTNNTALIAVPMQPGMSYIDMNRGLEAVSSRRYPEVMPTGFCFMVYRDLMQDLGGFDEGFESYGEESDFWMRVLHYTPGGEYARYRAVLADDTYLFHERGSSFGALGAEAHMGKRQHGSSRFKQLWPSFGQWRKTFNEQEVLAPLNTALPTKVAKSYSPYKIAFVTYSVAPCGGMNMIADIVNEYIERGVDARVVFVRRNEDDKSRINVVGHLHSGISAYGSPKEFVDNFSEDHFSNGVLVAATAELVPLVQAAAHEHKHLRTLLFAQSDDPLCAPDGLEEQIRTNYSKVDKIIAGSSWVEKKINQEYKTQTSGNILPGVNYDLFFPRDRSRGDERLTVMLPLIKDYWYKGYKRGVEMCQALTQLCQRNGKDIRIMAYGPVNVPECPNVIGLGPVEQPRLASLLGTEVDVFCDPSHFHSYGLPALEALASGVVPVMWDNFGVREYTDENNAKILPTEATPSQVATAIYNLLFKDEGDFNSLRIDSLRPERRQTRKDGVDNFISLVEKAFHLFTEKKKISVVTPHLRKHGGPTTILHMANQLQARGHDVEVFTVYTDVNPEVVSTTNCKVNLDWKRIPSCDVLISNSDNEHNAFFLAQDQVKKKVMLKLSHNPRFQQLEDQSLHLDWDAIVTSTSWLVDVCEKPLTDAGWTHPPREAKRIGWYHYGHETFNCIPTSRQYGTLQHQHGVRIGFLAHQHPLKGTNTAITALEAIKKKHNKTNIFAVGEWPNFPCPPWMRYAQDLNRSQMAALFKSTDIWITASTSEGLGRLALEAMSAGVVCILSDTGAEYAEHEKNCLVVPRGNPASLAKAIDRLVNDKILFSQLAKGGYETACKYADANEYVDALEEVILNV